MSGVESPDERLARTAADRAEAALRRRRVARAEEGVRDTGVTLDERRAALAREETDVERLEHLSWARIVAGLRGRHASDLERETAERDAARFAMREAEARHEQAKTELAAAQSALVELGDTDAAYRAALSSKEEWASRHAPQVATGLDRIAERRGALEAEQRESKEADDAGVTAHRLLAAASERLGSAEAWAGWDTFMGGGLITDMVKHSRIDEVRAQLHQADLALRAFARELADLNQAAVDRLDIPGGLSFFDVVFDNIFSDWAVLRRIGDAHRQVQETAERVRAVVTGLRTRRAEIAAELDDLARERERLLTT